MDGYGENGAPNRDRITQQHGKFCQNPDDGCDLQAYRKLAGLWLCVRCFWRFKRHCHGRKYKPWERYFEKRTRR